MNDENENEACECCGQTLDPERGHAAPVCDDECLHFLNNEEK